MNGRSALDRCMREELEERWKYYQYDTIMNNSYSIDARIESGKCFVWEYNDSGLCDTDRIKRIVTIKRKTAGCMSWSKQQERGVTRESFVKDSTRLAIA